MRGYATTIVVRVGSLPLGYHNLIVIYCQRPLDEILLIYYYSFMNNNKTSKNNEEAMAIAKVAWKLAKEKPATSKKISDKKHKPSNKSALNKA